jgi:hypothetical protein
MYPNAVESFLAVCAVAKGTLMLALLSIACAVGAACGLARLKVLVLIAASAIFAAIAVVLGSNLGLTGDRIILVVFSVLMLLQVSYLIGAVLSEMPARHQVSDRLPGKRELLWTVQMAIADELRVYFAPPLDELPQQLRAKLAMLDD